MKIQTMLNETQFIPSVGAISYSELTPMQVHVLKKIANGELDYDVARPREQMTMYELETLGLLTGGELTDAGNNMIDVINDEGMSAYTKEAIKRGSKLPSQPSSRIDDIAATSSAKYDSDTSELRF